MRPDAIGRSSFQLSREKYALEKLSSMTLRKGALQKNMVRVSTHKFNLSRNDAPWGITRPWSGFSETRDCRSSAAITSNRDEPPTANRLPSSCGDDPNRGRTPYCAKNISGNIAAMRNPNGTIMLIDDDAHFLMFVEHVLRGNGVTAPIQLAHDGEEAIAYLAGEGKFSARKIYPYPTFILTDLSMPKADGFAVLQFLKKNPERAVIPTVVLSSSSDLDDIRNAYLLGASSYHVKPMGLAKLGNLMKSIIDYWMACECPEVDAAGLQMPTYSVGKLGEHIL
jgi:CheY-like chemotaxis protein